MNYGTFATGTEKGKEKTEKPKEVVVQLRENEGGDPLPLFIEIAGMKDPGPGVRKKLKEFSWTDL